MRRELTNISSQEQEIIEKDALLKIWRSRGCGEIILLMYSIGITRILYSVEDLKAR
jgi:hypothetical protein